MSITNFSTVTKLIVAERASVSPTISGASQQNDNLVLNNEQKASVSTEVSDSENLQEGYEHYLDDDDGTFKLRKKQVEVEPDTITNAEQDAANDRQQNVQISPSSTGQALPNGKTKNSPDSNSPVRNPKPRLQRQSKDNHMLKTYILGSGFRKGTYEEKLQPEIITMLTDDRSAGENKDCKTVQLIASALGCLGIEQSQVNAAATAANESGSKTVEPANDANLELTPTRRRKQDLKSSAKDDQAEIIVDDDEEVLTPKASASKRRARKKMCNTSSTDKGDVNANSLKNQPALAFKKVTIVKEPFSASRSKSDNKLEVITDTNGAEVKDDVSAIKLSSKPPATSPATVRKWMFVNLTQPSTGKQVTKKVMLAMNPSTAARWDVVKGQVIKELFPNYVPTVKAAAEKKEEDDDVIVLSDSDDDGAATSKQSDSKAASSKTKARRRTVSKSEKVDMVSVLPRLNNQQETSEKAITVISPPKVDVIKKPVGADKPLVSKANISVVSLKKPTDVSQLQLLLTGSAAKGNSSNSSNKRKTDASENTSNKRKKKNTKQDEAYDYDDDVMQALRGSNFSFAKKLLSKDNKSKKSDGVGSSKAKVEGPSVRIKGSLANPISCEIVNVGKSEGGGSSSSGGNNTKRPKQLGEGAKSGSSSSLAAVSLTGPWLCSLCHQTDNTNGLGDLFGPYTLEQKHLDEKDVVLRRVDGASTSFSASQGGLLSPTRKREPSSLTPATEVWMHEECLVWSNGVFFGANRLYGLDEMFAAASAATCSRCLCTGASLGCLQKGCLTRFHVSCAVQAGCEMNAENFSLRCPRHKKPDSSK